MLDALLNAFLGNVVLLRLLLLVNAGCELNIFLLWLLLV